MKKIAETIVGMYLGLGELSFIVSIKFGLVGIIVLLWNVNTFLRGEGSNITLGIGVGVGTYVLVTCLPWLAAGYLKYLDKTEREAKRKNPQFLSIVEQKIRLNKGLDCHEDEFIFENVANRLKAGEEVQPEIESYYLLRNLDAFEELLFNADDKRFARMFEHFARSLDDEGMRLIFQKIPTRAGKYIESGKISDTALERLHKIFKTRS